MNVPALYRSPNEIGGPTTDTTSVFGRQQLPKKRAKKFIINQTLEWTISIIIKL